MLHHGKREVSRAWLTPPAWVLSAVSKGVRKLWGGKQEACGLSPRGGDRASLFSGMKPLLPVRLQTAPQPYFLMVTGVIPSLPLPGLLGSNGTPHLDACESAKNCAGLGGGCFLSRNLPCAHSCP